jgi:hypothetical protein
MSCQTKSMNNYGKKSTIEARHCGKPPSSDILYSLIGFAPTLGPWAA